MKDLVRAGYNAAGAAYTADRALNTDTLPLVDDLLNRLPGGAIVLDAGCGGGVPVARRLSEHVHVIGVDISETQLKLARQAVPSATFLCQDMTELRFPDASFDAICSIYAIIHVPREQHRELLENFYRMLRPSGLVLLCMGANDVPHWREDYFGAPMYWSHFDAATNLTMVRECGFDLIWDRVVPDPPGEHLFLLARKAYPRR